MKKISPQPIVVISPSYFVVDHKCFLSKWGVRHCFDVRQSLIRCATAVSRMFWYIHLGHGVAGATYSSVWFSAHFSRTCWSNRKKKKKQKNKWCMWQVGHSSILLRNLINWIIFFVEKYFASVVRFFGACINSYGWRYIIVSVMKLQNNLLFSNVECALQNVFMKWNLFVATKLLYNFLFQRKSPYVQLFGYKLRISIHLRVGSYCLSYRW